MYTFTSHNLPPYEPPKKRKAGRPSSAAHIGAAFLAPFISFAKYFCMNTSIHGFNHIAAPRRHWFERLLWAVATGLAVWGAIDVSLGQLTRYNENPTVVTLEKDFRSWTFSYPGITACLQDRVDPEKLIQTIKNYWNVDPTDDKYEYYAKFVRVVANSDLLHLDGYAEFVGDETLNVDFKQLVIDVYRVVEITNPSNNELRWTLVMTEHGVCDTTNTIVINDIALQKVNTNLTKTYPKQCGPAELCMIMLKSDLTTHFHIHSSYDIADIAYKPSTLVTRRVIANELVIMETGSAKGVKELSKKRRGCYYYDEPDIKGRKVYSTNTCRQHCRIKIAIELCGCRPFYYFYDDGPQCTVSGMACLAQYSLELVSIKGVKCNCMPQCTVSTYRVGASSTDDAPGSVFSRDGSIKFTVNIPRTRYTREILFHFQDLIVSFGGATGLFLGASFISFVEIIYFMFEKLFYNISTTITKKPKAKRDKPVSRPSSRRSMNDQDKTILSQRRKKRCHTKRSEFKSLPKCWRTIIMTTAILIVIIID